MNLPATLKYTKEHEWIRVEGDVAFIGITDHAQKELGDIVYVDIDTLDKEVAQRRSIRHRRSRKNGFRPVQPHQRHRTRNQRQARRQPRAGELRPLRRRLDDQDVHQQPG